jgi:DNA-binding beta-propeller fold protein YncE
METVFAESPDRVLAIQLGELPALQRPETKPYPDIGPSISWPLNGVPWRYASQGGYASPPGGGGPGQDPDDPKVQYKGRPGIDSRFEHLVLAFNRAGDIVEQWTQWDKFLRRPHGIYISPYDAEKHVWIVDDHNDVLYKFTNDGKQLLQTIGTKGKRGQDSMTFDRPTFMTFAPDGTMYISDGYNGHRVVKLDKDGKFVTAWGEPGAPGGKETRPNYFNTVHGITVDPKTGTVYASDRGNHRIQVFDKDGKFLRQWPVGDLTNLQFLIFASDGSGVWGFADRVSKVVKWDTEGHLLYAWGIVGDTPGAFLNPHAASTDQEGNLYVAEVGNGRVQKFTPRAGANPAFLVGPPVYAAWK